MKRLFFIFISIFITLFSISASSRGIVLNITLDQKYYSTFDVTTKARVDAAFNQFLRDLTLLPEITLRNSDNDNRMREIQKQSQIDAATGLGSENAVYSAEKGSRSDLAVSFAVNPIDKNTYQIVCSISEIETMRLITTENTKRVSLENVTKEETVDEIAYRILTDLEIRGFIKSIPMTVINQLHNSRYAEENFEKQNINEQSYENSSSSEWLEIGKKAFNNMNYKVAFEYLSKAKNTPETYYYMGYMYEMGYGTAQNFDKAAVLYEISGEQGNYEAQYRLGLCYELGRGVVKNTTKAIEWYKKAALQGFADAQNELGVAYCNGTGVTINYAEAVYWVQKAAEQNNVLAQYNMGFFFYNGIGVERDFVTAARWYSLSAAQGYAPAQNRFAICYLNGNGVHQSYADAIYWYSKAAEQGDFYAQYNLGDCYYFGYGVQKNYQKAKEWYQKSASQGYEEAKKALRTKSFTTTITPDNTSRVVTSNQGKKKSYNPSDSGAKEGFFLDVLYMNGAFFHGSDLTASLTWGGDLFYWGIDTGILLPKLFDDYSFNYTVNWGVASLDFLFGASLNIGNFRPYLTTGLGYYISIITASSTEKRNYSNNPENMIGYQIEGSVGVDYNFRHVCLGLLYKIKFIQDMGAVDSYGITVGINW